MRKLSEQEVTDIGKTRFKYRDEEPETTPPPVESMPSEVDTASNQSSKLASPFGEVQAAQTPPKGDSWFDKFKAGHVTNIKKAVEFTKGMAKSVTALPTEAARLGQNISDAFGSTAIGQKASEAIGNTFKGMVSKEDGEALKAMRDKSTEGSVITETQNSDQEMGKLAGEVAQAFVPIGGAAKGAQLTTRLAKAVNLGEKGTKIAGAVGKLGGEVLENTLQTAVQTGDLEQGKDAGVATAVLGTLAKPLGWAFNKAGNAIFSGVIPATPTERAKDMKRMFDMGEVASQTGFSWSKKGVINKLQGLANDMGSQVKTKIDEFVSANPGQKNNIEDLTAYVRKNMTDADLAQDMALSPLEIKQAREAVENTLKEYENLYKGQAMDLNAVQKFKQAFNPALKSEYKKAELAINKGAKYAEYQLQNAARETIEEVLPEVGKLNEEFAPILEALHRTKAKGGYSGYLTDVIAGAANAGSAGDLLDDPVGYTKNFILGALMKRGLTTTASKTFAGSAAKNMAKIVHSPGFYKTVGSMLAKLHNGSEDSSEQAKKED